MTTSDQERAAPAQQPVAWQYRTKSVQKAGVGWVWSGWKNGRAGKGYGFESEERALYSAPSEPELRAEIVSLTRERDFEQSSRLASEAQLGAQIENLIRELDEHRRVRDVYVVSSQEEYIARCRAEQERDELQKRVEALSAEVGTARAAAFEEAAQIAEQAGKPYMLHTATGAMMFRATVDKIASAIRSRAALDKGATT